MRNEIFIINYPQQGITQEKMLISHHLHEIGKTIQKHDDRRAYYKSLGEYFTDESPVFDAMSTGILYCNGVHEVVITEKLSEYEESLNQDVIEYMELKTEQ